MAGENRDTDIAAVWDSDRLNFRWGLLVRTAWKPMSHRNQCQTVSDEVVSEEVASGDVGSSEVVTGNVV